MPHRARPFALVSTRTAFIALFAAAVAALLALPALAQQSSAKLPETKPGQLLTEWLALCDAADLERMTNWEREHLADRWLTRIDAKVFAASQVSDCRANGGFRVTEIGTNTPRQLVVVASGPKLQAWYRVSLTLDASGKIDPVMAMPTTPPEASLPRDLSDAALQREIASTASRLHAADRFSGIVMAARGTQPIVTLAVGYADRTAKTPIATTSRFTIGSMGKLFTLAAIGQLVDQGKLSFEDTVGKFFPAFANETVRNNVTVGMLLSHTSGMGDFLARRTPSMMKKGVVRASEFVPLYEKDEPQFEPGKGWAYSNAGLALAGAIVEKVSGDAYPDYIRKHVFAPAGMRNSDPNNIPRADARMVTPYTKPRGAGADAGWHEAEHDIGSPAGGAISTAEDLLRFAEALRGGKLVSRPTFEKMIQPHGTMPGAGDYGYAMVIAKVYGRTVVGHGGAFPGVSTELYIVLDSPYTAVVLANQDAPAAELFGETVRAMLVKKAGPARVQTDAAAWGSDIEILKNDLPARHINLFSKISRADYVARIEQLKARLATLNDDERYVEMARIVAAVGDAHTKLSPPPAGTALPVMLYRFRDGLYIVNTTEAYKPLLYGRVIAVGGKPIADVEHAVASIVPCENEASAWLALGQFAALTRVLHGLGITRDTIGAAVTVKKSDGATVTATMAAISMAERPQWVVGAPQPDSLPLYRRNSARLYWYEYLPESNVVYVKYNSCQEMKDQSFADFTRQVFERVDQSPGARVVVDLRNNGGGNSAIFSPFLQALKQRPALGAQGRLLVVIGRQTFSSAILNAIALKQDSRAVLIGEPTGGRPNHFGEMRVLDLPGTRLKVSYSTKYFKESSVDTASLEPDVRVDMTIDDVAAGRDPVLERATRTSGTATTRR